MDINQVIILIFGACAVFVSQLKSKKLNKLACLFGLISQPFFVYETYQAGQMGMFVLSVLYTGIWIMGLYNFWISPYLNASNHQVLEPKNEVNIMKNINAEVSVAEAALALRMALSAAELQGNISENQAITGIEEINKVESILKCHGKNSSSYFSEEARSEALSKAKAFAKDKRVEVVFGYCNFAGWKFVVATDKFDVASLGDQLLVSPDVA